MPFCSNCGAKLAPDSRFCSSCGAPVPAVEKPREMQRTFQVTGRPRLVVTHAAAGGLVEVKPGPVGQVTVDLKTERPEYLDWDFRQDGDTITVTCRQPFYRYLWAPFMGGLRADLLIATPPETDVDIEATLANIAVTGLSGSVASRASIGQVELRDCKGKLRARSETGRVLLLGVEGTVSASGAVGSIDFEGSLASGDNWFRTNTGTIHLTLLGEPDLVLEASTDLGRVTCDLELADAYIGERRCRGRIGAGAGKLIVEANLGSITITRRPTAKPQRST